jgi:hypothetical protein
MPKRIPPAAHPDHGSVVYRVTLIDSDNKRYEMLFTLDATKLQGLLNAMVLAGVGERKLPHTPFTVKQRRLLDGKEGSY